MVNLSGVGMGKYTRIFIGICAAFLVVSVLYELIFGAFDENPNLGFSQQDVTSRHFAQNENGRKVYVLAIDVDNNKIVDSDSLRKGEDFFVVVNAKSSALLDQKASLDDKLLVFTNIQSLLKYDQNQDGNINAIDPLYHDLELISFIGSQHGHIISKMKNAGIYSIHLNPHAIKSYALKEEANSDEEIGYAVMADSTRRAVHLIPFELPKSRSNVESN
jgi:hypothetical protein